MNIQTINARKTRGFTLIELAVVIAVLGIIAMIAMPNYQDMMVQQRLGSAAQQLHTSLMLARSEAIKRNADVRIQRSGANWGGGWEIINVADGDMITPHDPLNGVTVTTDPATLTQITFNRTGRSSSIGEIFTICSNPERGGTERIIRMETSGSARVERGGTCPG
ncbi:MAG: GspH/FimT family pseudopilin [Gammaproteobacteria bacterium]|nr:GspH/FimT family pseudopilin [Gammaproteobacteria bacterium]